MYIFLYICNISIIRGFAYNNFIINITIEYASGDPGMNDLICGIEKGKQVRILYELVTVNAERLSFVSLDQCREGRQMR